MTTPLAQEHATHVNTITRFVMDFLEEHPRVADHALKAGNIHGFRGKVIIYLDPWRRSHDARRREVAFTLGDVDWYVVRGHAARLELAPGAVDAPA